MMKPVKKKSDRTKVIVPKEEPEEFDEDEEADEEEADEEEADEEEADEEDMAEEIKKEVSKDIDETQGEAKTQLTKGEVEDIIQGHIIKLDAWFKLYKEMQ